MRFKIKGFSMLAIVFICTPIAIGWAEDCPANDKHCQLRQKQMQAFISAGIKPTTPVESTDTTKNAKEKITEGSTAFVIPTPKKYNYTGDGNLVEVDTTEDATKDATTHKDNSVANLVNSIKQQSDKSSNGDTTISSPAKGIVYQ